MSFLSFTGKKALVTGAGKGIGRAITKALVQSGAKTTAISRTQSDLDSLKSEHPEVNNICLDISNWDQTRKTVSQLGHFDFLVNNAAIVKSEPFLEVSVDDLDSVFDTNFKAVFNISQLIAKDMVNHGKGGSIVNISSIGSMKAFYANATYCASKSALDMLTKVMAVELGPYEIRVNGVLPGLTLTAMMAEMWHEDKPETQAVKQMTPLREFNQAEDVVKPVMFLLSEEAKRITGALLPVDGGLLVT